MQLIIEFKDDCELTTTYYPVEKDCFQKIEDGYLNLERELELFRISLIYYSKRNCV
jgi:hypothetical protein